jgi:hypothetical protein
MHNISKFNVMSDNYEKSRKKTEDSEHETKRETVTKTEASRRKSTK